MPVCGYVLLPESIRRARARALDHLLRFPFSLAWPPWPPATVGAVATATGGTSRGATGAPDTACREVGGGYVRSCHGTITQWLQTRCCAGAGVAHGEQRSAVEQPSLSHWCASLSVLW